MDPNGGVPYRGPPSNGSNMNGRPFTPRNEAAMPEPLRPSPTVSRAEKYEDEKRRITATCFNKTDDEGKPLQSYITHIRVQEDAVYQSSPAPPNHPAHHKKPRVIIVAVKNNGRVTMHKARENDDSSFQIGKSWPMEELQSIEIFSTATARSPEEENRAKWAGPTGFVIAIGKPYYWQANTAKEKDFFIGSLVKIFNKYTEGKVPELIGFEQREKDQILGATRPPQAFPGAPRQGSIPSQDGQPPRPAASSPAPPTAPQPVRSPPPAQPTPPPGPQGISQPPPFHSPLRPYSPAGRPNAASPGPDSRNVSTTSSDFSRPSGPRAFPSPAQSPGPNPNQTGYRPRGPTPQLSQRPSQDRIPRQPPNQDQPRPGFMQSPPSGPSPRLTPMGSRSNLGDSQADGLQPPILSPRRQADRGRSRQDQRPDASFPSQSPEPQPSSGSALASASADRWRSLNDQGRSTPNQSQTPPSSIGAPPGSAGATSTSSRSVTPQAPPMNGAAQGPPDRRRPLMKDQANDLSHRPYLPPSSERSSPRPTSPQGPREPRSPTERSATPSITQIPAYDSPDIAPAVETPTSEAKPPLPEVTTDRNLPSVSNNKDVPRNGTVEPPVDATEPPSVPAEPGSEQYRPGLGPMLNKKADVASKFRKAVNAHNAFKPRAGGAGERLLGAVAKSTNEPDGITGVVPARSAARPVTQDEPKPAVSEPLSREKSIDAPPLETKQEPPSVEVASPNTVENEIPAAAREARPKPASRSTSSTTAESLKQPRPQRKSRSASRQPKKRRSNAFASALSAMDIDPYALGGREADFEDVLSEFGWKRGFLQTKKMDALEADLRREVGRLEAGSWLGHTDRKDDRVDVVEKLLDKAIAECDEMEGLLTLYSVELSTLTDDIAYIEAQSQGLQVQTANQKLLHTELQNLVNTISLDTGHMEPLRNANLGDFQGLELVESTLLKLYKALQRTDPGSINTESSSSPVPGSGRSTTTMRALQERKESYTSESNSFLYRLRHHIEQQFITAFNKTKDGLSRTSVSNKDHATLHDLARGELWRYSPLILFAKEVNRDAWDDMLRAYRGRAAEAYRDEMLQNAAEWKRRARKTTGEEQDALFTAQEKESEGLTSTARKLTVKRSQTLARSLRQASSEKKTSIVQNRDGNQMPFEVFAGALFENLPLVAAEQNFVVDFFHATTLQDLDFAEAVGSGPPSSRRGTDLFEKRPVEPDRAMSKAVIESMEHIFRTWPNELQSLLDWATTQDPFQGIGILCAIERAMQEHADTSQEFIIRTLTRLHDSLAGLFTRFVDEQVRAIEATKVKIKKRRGVMAFIKVFPNFSAIVENMLPAANDPNNKTLEIRTNVDNAYDRINKAMFSSLKQIAKEAPNSLSAHAASSQSNQINGMGIMGVVTGNTADPEDKEALNHEILLIENMFHYYTEVDERASPVLGVWRGKAMLEMSEHQDRYVNAVTRRPLGRLLDFLEGLEALGPAGAAAAAAAGTNTNDDGPAQARHQRSHSHSTYSRAAFKKLLASSYDAREFRRGIDALRKRVEKHFGESSDDAAQNQRLVSQILAECERKYAAVVERVEAVRDEVYGGEVEVEFGRGDVSQGFRR